MNLLAGGPPFTVESLAEELGVSTWSVRRALPRIGFTRIQGRILVPRAAVEAYLQSRFVPPTKTPATRRRKGASGQLADIVQAAEQRVKRGRR